MNVDNQTDITSYQDINGIFEEFSRELQRILDEQLIGLYLTGSLTYGGFEYNSSDIDFLVILRDVLSNEQLVQVKNLHKLIANKYPVWAKRIECSYITEEMLKNIDPPIKPRPYVNDCKFWDEALYGNEWLLNLYAFFKFGVALVGPKPKTLIDHPINIEAVREASKKCLHQEWEPLLKDPSPLKDSHYQAYLIFTLCRILYGARNDSIVSKKVASEWVKQTYGKPWCNLIEKAEIWQYGQTMDEVEEILNFLRFTLLELK